MKLRRFVLLSITLAAVATTALTGCEPTFIENAARRSLSSFVIDLVSTAANATIAPQP